MRTILLAGVLLLWGCTTYRAAFLRYTDEVLPPKKQDSPMPLFRGEPDRPHREIGEILVAGGSYEDLEALRLRLLRKARAVGADAVKLVRVRTLEDETYYYDFYGYGWYGPWYWGLGFPGYGHAYRTTRVYPEIRGVAIVWTDAKPEK